MSDQEAARLAEEVMNESDSNTVTSDIGYLDSQLQSDPLDSSGTFQEQSQAPYVCVYCRKDCESRHKLNKHMKKHTKPYKCLAPLEGIPEGLPTRCPEAFAAEKDLHRHQEVHHNKDRKGYDCSDCHKKFMRKDYVVRHKKRRSCKRERDVEAI